MMPPIDDEYFGLSPINFKQMRENLDAEPVSRFHIKWKGTLVDLPVYKISIKHLRYNLWNTRIKPHLMEYIAKNSLDDDYFQTIDKDSLKTQKMINNYLKLNHDRKPALKFFKDPKNLPEIQEPLISTVDGRILNGNQRLCCFRELESEDSVKYEHLQTAYVAFLPDNGTAEDERNLEATFQETKLAAVAFDWIQSGIWALDERKKGVSAAKIGKTLGCSEADVNEKIQIINLADEFLTYDGKKGFWHTLRSMELKQAFQTLAQKINQQKVRKEREKLKKMSFKLMVDNRESAKAAGRNIHLLITDLSKNLDKFTLDEEEEDHTQDDDLFAPPEKKKEKKVKKDVMKIDINSVDSKSLAKNIADTEVVRKGMHQASLDKTFAKRQLKMAGTTFKNIVDKWELQDKKGIEKLVDKALEELNRIKKLIDRE